jgi:glycosyltransferase involved in cell wall biosynthesis
MRSKNCIYYAPVKNKYFLKWEYYQVDLRMLKASGCDVIVCHNLKDFILSVLSRKPIFVYFWWWHSSFLTVLISKCLRIPVLGTGAVHMFDESGSLDFYSRSLIYRVLNRLSWKLADANLFISKSQLRQILSHETVKNPQLLKSSILDDNLGNLKTFEPTKKINVLTVCWLTKAQLQRKSIYQLLSAILLLDVETRQKFIVTIIGSHGDGFDELNNYLIFNGLSENVKILVDVDQNQKNYLYKSSDIYFQASSYEGFGNSVLEAMSFGLPAIVSGYTSQPEVVIDSGYVLRQLDSHNILRALKDYSALNILQINEMRNDTFQTVVIHHSFEIRLKKFKEILLGLDIIL